MEPESLTTRGTLTNPLAAGFAGRLIVNKGYGTYALTKIS
jgi:hypothetical protein